MEADMMATAAAISMLRSVQLNRGDGLVMPHVVVQKLRRIEQRFNAEIEDYFSDPDKQATQ